jgi:hypothetical protein
LQLDIGGRQNRRVITQPTIFFPFMLRSGMTTDLLMRQVT